MMHPTHWHTSFTRSTAVHVDERGVIFAEPMGVVPEDPDETASRWSYPNRDPSALASDAEDEEDPDL